MKNKEITNFLFKVIFVPSKKIFEFTLGEYIWELTPEEFLKICDEIFSQRDISFNFNKAARNADVTSFRMNNMGEATRVQIVSYLRKIRGSYFLNVGIQDGNARK